MPIFEKNDRYILFLHIPKAGGTTLEHILMANGWHMHLFEGGEGLSNLNPALKCSPQHWHWSIIRDIVNIDKFLVSFCIIRHPMRRIMSEFSWRKKYFGIGEDADTWINYALDTYSNNPFVHDNHIRPQSDFVADRLKVFKIEASMNPVIDHIQSATGQRIEYEEGFRAMQSHSNGPTTSAERISGETNQRIHDFYANDFALWEDIS